MPQHLCARRSRTPLALAAALVLLGHAALLRTPAASTTRSAAMPALALQLVPARSIAAPRPAPATAPAPAPAPALQPSPAPSSTVSTAATPAYAEPATLDQPLVPRSAPDLHHLQGLRFSGLPIRLRLFIDAVGQVVQVRVLDAQEDGDTLAAVTGMFEATAFVPGRRGGVPVASFTDIELRLGGPEG